MTTAHRKTFSRLSAAILVGLYWGQAAAAQQIDFSHRYRATLDYAEESRGYPWTCTAQDVWRLKEFSYALGNEFAVRLGPSQVVFGCHGTNVLWAVVIPDQPGLVVKAEQGRGEHITSIWMRFHPARVGELFPAAAVVGQGDAKARPPALRVAAHKMRGCWHAGNVPMVPSRNVITLDMETQEGRRRFFSLDTNSGKIEYQDFFRTRTVPPVKPLDPQAALTAFDQVWIAFDRQYAMFSIKPQVDWAKLRETYRPRAAAAKTNQELATVLSEMLDHLEDLHVYVQVDGQYVPGYNRPRPLNANWNAPASLIGPVTSIGRDLHWGRTRDGIGYINIHGLSDDSLPDAFDEVLGQMAETKGIILDLRFNGGGSEPLGCQVAARFLDRPRVYSLSQFRTGPKHSDLGPKQERVCGPDGPWHYVGPVIVLQGRKTMSSAESFALALAECPQATTMGDNTAGSSGNPRRVGTDCGIIVNLPQWIDMDPQGKPIDVVGVAPRVKIDTKPSDFGANRDPVLTAALDRLRARMKTEKAPPGGFLQHRPGVLRPEDRPKVISVFPAPDATGVDVHSEIRIRFDRPMDPNKMGLSAERDNANNVFRLRASPQYLRKTNEFVVPVLFRPGVHYRLGFQQYRYALDFCSRDGVAAKPYSWGFATRERAESPKSAQPHVVSIDPPSGSQTGRFTTIRVRFDRPMVPEAFELKGSISPTKKEPVDPSEMKVTAPFQIAYDAALQTFTLHALLPSNAKTRLELRGFRGADGGQAQPIFVEYQVDGKLYRPEQEARIVEAGRSARLHEVVEAVRRKRLALKSLEETVRETNIPDDFNDRSNWVRGVWMSYARFAFQGDRQFYADATGIMRRPPFTECFRVGSDGRECWGYWAGRLGDAPERKNVDFRPYNGVHKKLVVICDPFGWKRFSSTETAIEALKLEYLGGVTRDGKSCHRIRSWPATEDAAEGLREWLIDARSLLPVVCDIYWSGGGRRYEFLYTRIDEPIDPELFQSPRGPDIQRRLSELLEGYDYFNWRACDGSDGEMHAGYGQSGSNGGRGSGM
jgi:hypothetical protein